MATTYNWEKKPAYFEVTLEKHNYLQESEVWAFDF